MREQNKRKLIKKLSEVAGNTYGEPLYLRPYETDDKSIGEIARAAGVKKSAIAQKLLHLALAGKTYDFPSEKQELNKLEWLITNEKHKLIRADVFDARLERLEEHARQMETLNQKTAENSHFIRILISEIYCMTNVCMTFLNEIFTRIVEYFSPVPIEKQNSVAFANRNVLVLVEHSLAELKRMSQHYDPELEEIEPELLYIFTKIEKLRRRILSSDIKVHPEHK